VTPAIQENLELLTAQETAKLLRTSYGALAVGRCKRRTKLRYIRLGRKILYRRSDIDAFLISQIVDPATGAKKKAAR
jgi:hypothetical protein